MNSLFVFELCFWSNHCIYRRLTDWPLYSTESFKWCTCLSVCIFVCLCIICYCMFDVIFWMNKRQYIILYFVLYSTLNGVEYSRCTAQPCSTIRVKHVVYSNLHVVTTYSSMFIEPSVFPAYLKVCAITAKCNYWEARPQNCLSDRCSNLIICALLWATEGQWLEVLSYCTCYIISFDLDSDELTHHWLS